MPLCAMNHAPRKNMLKILNFALLQQFSFQSSFELKIKKYFTPRRKFLGNVCLVSNSGQHRSHLIIFPRKFMNNIRIIFVFNQAWM